MMQTEYRVGKVPVARCLGERMMESEVLVSNGQKIPFAIGHLCLGHDFFQFLYLIFRDPMDRQPCRYSAQFGHNLHQFNIRNQV